MKHILSILILFFVSCQLQTADMVIQNVHVVDVESGEVVENQSVFIRDGIIADIKPYDSEVDAERVINGTGKYLVPGLWDMHVHFRGGEELIDENKKLLPLYIANGITTVRDGGGDITPSVLEWREQVESRDLVGPKIFTSGPKLDGPDARWAGSIPIENVDEIPAALDSLEGLGVDYVKIYDSTLSGHLFLTVVEQASERGFPVTGHMPFEVIFSESVEKGLSATEHIFYALKGHSSEEHEITQELIERSGSENPMGFLEVLQHVTDSQDDETAQALYQTMIEHETGLIPTLHIMDVLANLKVRNHAEDEYLDYIGPGIRETYEGRYQAALRAPDDRPNIYDLPEYRPLVTEMMSNGVRIYAGSDAGPFNTFVYPGISLHKELEIFVEAGFTPAEALRTATINPPYFFELQDKYGQVKEGFTADLLLLDSNPLDDIGNTQQINRVIINGESIYNEDDLAEMLDELREMYSE